MSLELQNFDAFAAARGPSSWVPVRDRDGWYPIDDAQTLEQVMDYVSEQPETSLPVRPPDPEWEALGDRGKTAKLLHEAGLGSKAHRYGDCYRKGIPYDCAGCGRKAYTRFHCGNRFCEKCGKKIMRELLDKYADPVAEMIAARPSHAGMTLARINFTMRASGECPAPDEIRRFNQAVRDTLKMIAPGGEYGAVWANEFGYEVRGRKADRKAGGLNLHAHGLYYGSRVSWDKVRDAWVKALRRHGLEGQGVWITFLKGWQRNPARAVRHALVHMFKYISKVPAESPERVAALEVAFNGVRRVHSVGLFYKLQRISEELKEIAPRCPDCGNPMHRAYGRPWERFPVEALESEGRVEITDGRQKPSFEGRAGP
jgi:hypothetical protein